ncbi:MAG: DUF6798 domain-containing protein [Thermoguttaceae bacterium]
MDVPWKTRGQAAVEVLLILAVFSLQGAWPVPDVNEPYYLGKAIHSWNPDWLRGDFFLGSADTHQVFDFTFGWLSLWLGPTSLAWTGRVLTWLLLAWAWRRLSVAIVPRPWWSVLTAALFGCLTERCHMAGEWVIGGVEAKGFAYVLVLLAVESVVRNRWNRGLIQLGAASAFHVLAGGWAAVAAGLAWFFLHFQTFWTGIAKGKQKIPTLRSLWPGLIFGLLLALPGIVPSLLLDWGVDRQTAAEAHRIYVFERLPHHLLLAGIQPALIARMVALWLFWLLLGRWNSEQNRTRLRAFVAGAVAISMVGALLQLTVFVDPTTAAGLLRFYWFRLTDVALPMGVALETVATVVGATSASASDDHRKTASRTVRVVGLTLAVLVAALHLGDLASIRIRRPVPRSHRVVEGSAASERRTADFADWRDACRWVADSGRIPSDARFLVPRLSQTFPWYAHRTVVATVKDVPQDAKTLVQWWQRVNDIYKTGLEPPELRWYPSLAAAGVDRLQRWGKQYDAQFVLTERTEPLLPLNVVYGNRGYVIYRLGGK